VIGETTVFCETAMLIPAALPAIAAVLACYATAGADIQSRNLEPEAQVRLELADGRRVECKVFRWDGFGLEGSCGAIAWTALKQNTQFSVLKAMLSERDTEACADAAAVVLSLDEAGIAAKPALDWAKKAGAAAERLELAKQEASALKAARAAKMKSERAERLSRLTPEAGVFPSKPWQDLHSADVGAVGAASIEATRAILAKTGGSATLHEAEHIALLTESGDEKHVADAAFLERFYRDWRDRFEDVSIRIAEQGAIPVVIVQDRDRWRLLVQIAFGGDSAQHLDAVTIYPASGTPAEPRPIVLVHPDSDPVRQRSNACVGLARAMLHLASSMERGPAWLNEGLPRAMADVSVPEAKRDADFRRTALAAVRKGPGFAPVLAASYGEGIWASDPVLARALSYLFTRWLADGAPQQLLRYAEAPRTSEGETARFKRIMGMSLDEAVARATQWFQTND
jgi:hypothetical protein